MNKERIKSFIRKYGKKVVADLLVKLVSHGLFLIIINFFG